MKKVIVYFTDSRLEEGLDSAVRKQILKAAGGIPIISVTQKPLDFGHNICVGIKPRCYLSLYQQLKIGIGATKKGSIIYACEHDVFYHPGHFEYVPESDDEIFFNLNRYYWTRNTDLFIKAIGHRALSQAVAHRDVFLAHATEQVELREKNLPSPCTGPFNNFVSDFSNIDIRHGGNFSESWAFKNLKDKSSRIEYTLPHWGTPRRFQERVGYSNVNTETVKMLHMMSNPEDNEGPITVNVYRKHLPGLFKALNYKKGAEIGVKRGLFSELLCKEIPNLELKCIDPYLPGPTVDWDSAESYFKEAQERLAGYNAQVIKKTSKHAAGEDVPKWSLDFVYIDANHSFNSVMQDIIMWDSRVRPGGVVSGHDYDNPGVKAAVDVYAKVHGHELFITKMGDEYPDSSPSWFFGKK